MYNVTIPLRRVVITRNDVVGVGDDDMLVRHADIHRTVQHYIFLDVLRAVVDLAQLKLGADIHATFDVRIGQLCNDKKTCSSKQRFKRKEIDKNAYISFRNIQANNDKINIIG